MTSFSDLLSQIEYRGDDEAHVEIPETWMQGRTTYGGLTSALCLEAAKQAAPDIPIRTAQIAFVGPAGGPVSLSSSVLRKGRNTVVVSVDMMTEAGMAARCVFVFGAPRESALKFNRLKRPATKHHSEIPGGSTPPTAPSFLSNFDVKRAAGDLPVSGAGAGEVGLWIKHRDEKAPQTATTLLALADVPWPAALPMLKAPAPGSSMTWMAEFVDESPDFADNWFYAHSVAETAQNGYSSQGMAMYNENGDAVLIGRQTVTIFG